MSRDAPANRSSRSRQDDAELSSRGEPGGPVEGTPARNATVVLALRSSPCRCHPSTLHQGRVS